MKHGVALGCVVAMSLLASTVAAWPRDIVVEPPTPIKKTRSLRKSIATPPSAPVTPLVSRLAPARSLDRLPPGALPPLPVKPTAAPAPTPTTSATTTPTATATSAPVATSAPAAPQPSASSPSSEITGSYTLAGQGNDGSKYTGTATLTKIGGGMYTASWVIGSNTFTGVCFRDTGTLACGWSVKQKDANVMSYLIDNVSDSLNGVWFSEGETKLGTENLKPPGKLRADLVGNYTITKGANPDGSHYTGSVKITAVPTVCASCYTLAWTLGATSQSGVGLRAPGNEPILAAGFADGGATYGALQYQINGKVLTGTWMQSINGAVSAGTETATRP